MGQDRPLERAPALGGVPAPLPRRRRRLPPSSRQHLVKRPGHLRAWRDHLPLRLRPLERRLAGRAHRGLIDFDHARPAPPLFDIAYALEYAAPFRDDSECLRWLRYPRPPDRRRRIEIFCDTYGIAVPADITGRVAWQQRLVLEHCQALARQGIEPQVTWVREGYLDTIRARINWTESLHIP